MFRNIVIPILAIAGIIFSIFMIYWVARTPPELPILFAPPKSPYAHYIAAEGTIESVDENIKIGVAYPDLIWESYVSVGDLVKKGQPLFKLDTRQQEADLAAAFCALKVAKTTFDDRSQQFEYYERLIDKSAVSQRDYTQAFYDKQRAYDELRLAFARVKQIKTSIERAIIIAPMDGEILQENARIGEFANVNPFDNIPLMIFGNTKKFELRVNVAEEDAWRVIPNAPAMAYVRGNSSLSMPLKFSYIEPLIVPKQTLTGSDFERVDTRVLQVIYLFEKNSHPVYIGQLLDVYMEAKPSRVS